MATPPTKLNVGCGRNLLDGWVNLNDRWVEGMVQGRDVVADVQAQDLWFDSYHDHFDEILCSHVVEHLERPLQAMENLWLVAQNGCSLTIRCPHGASDDAWEDQTHVRPYFPVSFAAFAQPYYWKADYGYRGDWQVEDVELYVGEALRQMEKEQIHRHVQAGRNMIHEMVATLRAVKPARPPDRTLLQDLSVTYVK